MVVRFAFAAGAKKYLMSGSFQTKPELVESVKERYEINDEEQFSFFTGTRGENRKVIIEISNKQQTRMRSASGMKHKTST